MKRLMVLGAYALSHFVNKMLSGDACRARAVAAGAVLIAVPVVLVMAQEEPVEELIWGEPGMFIVPVGGTDMGGDPRVLELSFDPVKRFPRSLNLSGAAPVVSLVGRERITFRVMSPDASAVKVGFRFPDGSWAPGGVLSGLDGTWRDVTLSVPAVAGSVETVSVVYIAPMDWGRPLPRVFFQWIKFDVGPEAPPDPGEVPVMTLNEALMKLGTAVLVTGELHFVFRDGTEADVVVDWRGE